MIGMSGEPGYRAIGSVTYKANDAEQTVAMPACVLPGPIELGPLRIGIDQRDPLSLPARLAGEMRCNRRCADAAFPIEQRDDHRRLPPVSHRSAPRPTSKRLDSCMLDSKLGGSEVTELSPKNAASSS